MVIIYIELDWTVWFFFFNFIKSETSSIPKQHFEKLFEGKAKLNFIFINDSGHYKNK